MGDDEEPLSGLLRLSNDVLREVLDHIEADPDRSVSIDRRAYLSVESFRPPSPPPPLCAQDIGNFRLVCRRFGDLGIPYQFTRISTRFSPAGFQRLDRICSRQHLAKHTKKFSYLIPDFYVEGRVRVRELLTHAGGELQALDASYFERKVAAQQRIVKGGEDSKVLRKAMTAFRSLQHVQILRLQDEADRHLVEYIRESDGELDELVDLRWTLACTHATRTMVEALASARSPFSRFSGPMMNAQGSLAFNGKSPDTLGFLAERLTCLELHFEDGPTLSGKINQLSSLFGRVFSSAKNMQAVHIGFPTQQPSEMPLERIFHSVCWDKLRAFGVQSWRLNSSEIIDLARRHRKTLKGLRLRDVLLHEGSMWRDVLGMLREEMEVLEWVSLRRIDYSSHFDEIWAGSMEIVDYPPGTASESDDEDTFHAHVDEDNDDGEDHRTEEEEEEDDDEDDEENDWDTNLDAMSNADSDQGPDANALTLSPDTPASLPFCTCSQGSYPATANDLGDDGKAVFYQQRKLWEKWVIGKCPEHGST